MNLTAKEKAKELVLQFHDIGLIVWSDAKQCALLAVDELINSTVNYLYPQSKFTRNTFKREYWQEVKQEILKLQ
jgi:hypothetical protein